MLFISLQKEEDAQDQVWMHYLEEIIVKENLNPW